MSTIVSRIAVLLGLIGAEGPVGTHLGLFGLLWALLSGRFLRSRGAVVIFHKKCDWVDEVSNTYGRIPDH